MDFQANALVMRTGAGSAKRRRIDEDLKHRIVHNSMQAGTASTPQMMARAMGGMHQTTPGKWFSTHMGIYKKSLEMSMQNAQRVSVSYDASRVGMPKEETLTIAVLDSLKDRAGWLPPQA
eukprot:5963279-Pyramimonas_sp.AAC.1